MPVCPHSLFFLQHLSIFLNTELLFGGFLCLDLDVLIACSVLWPHKTNLKLFGDVEPLHYMALFMVLVADSTLFGST